MDRERAGDDRSERDRRRSPVFTAEVMDSVPALERLVEFQRRHPGHPESNLDLLGAALRSSPAVTPWSVQVYRDGEPSLLMVGQRGDGRLRWRFGYRSVLGARISTIEVRRGGWLGDLSPAGVEFLWRYLQDRLREGAADALYLRDLRSDSTIHDVFRSRSSWLWRDRSRPAWPTRRTPARPRSG